MTTHDHDHATVTCPVCGLARPDEEDHTDGPREYCADCWASLGGDLMEYSTGRYLGAATTEQAQASVCAAQYDGGAGVIILDGDGDVVPADRDDGTGWRCYVL